MCIHTYTYVCIHPNQQVFAYLYIYIRMYIYIYTYTYVCIYIYTYVCIYIYIHINTYVYIYTSTSVCIFTWILHTGALYIERTEFLFISSFSSTVTVSSPPYWDSQPFSPAPPLIFRVLRSHSLTLYSFLTPACSRSLSSVRVLSLPLFFALSLVRAPLSLSLSLSL